MSRVRPSLNVAGACGLVTVAPVERAHVLEFGSSLSSVTPPFRETLGIGRSDGTVQARFNDPEVWSEAQEGGYSFLFFALSQPNLTGLPSVPSGLITRYSTRI
jgi:hypothetical protein